MVSDRQHPRSQLVLPGESPALLEPRNDFVAVGKIINGITALGMRLQRKADVGNLLQVSEFGPADGLHHRPQFIHVMLSCSTVASDTHTKYGTWTTATHL